MLCFGRAFLFGKGTYPEMIYVMPESGPCAIIGA